MRHRLRVDPSSTLLRDIVPGHVWKQAPFRFNPLAFALESERLKEKIVDEDVQMDSYDRFHESPTTPMLYAVGGNPDDSKAKLFAAYLVQVHLRALKSRAHVIWHSVHGGFQNPVLKPQQEPSMLVVTNLSPVATQVKLDKVRDIADRYPEIPIVLVIAGEDPMSFMMTRLYLPVHGIAYFCEALLKKKVEIF